MINDMYRLNMEVILTANKFRGMEPGVFHDGIARQIEQSRLSSSYASDKNRILNFFRKLLGTRTDELIVETADC